MPHPLHKRFLILHHLSGRADRSSNSAVGLMTAVVVSQSQTHAKGDMGDRHRHCHRVETPDHVNLHLSQEFSRGQKMLTQYEITCPPVDEKTEFS